MEVLRLAWAAGVLAALAALAYLLLQVWLQVQPLLDALR